jgi:hypothetical protein
MKTRGRDTARVNTCTRRPFLAPPNGTSLFLGRAARRGRRRGRTGGVSRATRGGEWAQGVWVTRAREHAGEGLGPPPPTLARRGRAQVPEVRRTAPRDHGDQRGRIGGAKPTEAPAVARCSSSSRSGSRCRGVLHPLRLDGGLHAANRGPRRSRMGQKRWTTAHVSHAGKPPLITLLTGLLPPTWNHELTCTTTPSCPSTGRKRQFSDGGRCAPLYVLVPIPCSIRGHGSM